MFCEKCGNELASNDKFCPRCGTPAKYASGADENSEWFYIIESTRLGPFSNDKIISLINDGTVTRNTLVWKQGMTNWIPASQTELIDVIKKTVPPMPTEAISNKFAWSLATVPILSSWIIGQFGMSMMVITICTIALNIVFLMLDSDVLNKSGMNVNSWMWMGIVLVPAYLFVRASKTDRKYGYAITWCVMFFLDLLI